MPCRSRIEKEFPKLFTTSELPAESITIPWSIKMRLTILTFWSEDSDNVRHTTIYMKVIQMIKA